MKIFVKSYEQSKARLGYAMARKFAQSESMRRVYVLTPTDGTDNTDYLGPRKFSLSQMSRAKLA